MDITFVQLSIVPMVISVLASVICALPGNWLVLRRQSLAGDAISHVVLPGVVGAFVVTGTLSTSAMLVGAAGAAVVAIALIEVIRRLGRIEPGAAMGVVFTALFASGVLWLEQSHSSSVHLDVEHVLYGNLESLIWLEADSWQAFADPQVWQTLPTQLPRLAGLLLVVIVVLRLLWRNLIMATFDPGFAASVGARPNFTSLLLMMLVALSAVAAFEAVGAIIVVAMFICPAATARLMTDRLAAQTTWSVFFASSAALLGYVLAAWGPLWLGFDTSLSAAGMIAATGGVMLLIAALKGPCRKPV